VYGTKAEGARAVCLRKPPGERRHDFHFDRVFAQEAQQSDLFEELGPLLPGILEGIHVCIFAYGQTGAGKTYTLAGDRSGTEPGLQDLAIAEVLRLAENFEVRLSALEIYNESIQDLLLSDSKSDDRLEVRQSRETLNEDEEWPSPFGSMRVPGLRSWTVRGAKDVDSALQRVSSNRHTASTALNDKSSRSHTVLSLSVRRSDSEAPVGVLHIVDLAGSERTKISQAEGMQMKEANCINRSLSALADVLFALGDSTSSSHVPYRNSKLTYLLQDALGGPGCKTFLFAQVSPDAVDAHESYSTLTFAARVATSVQKGKLRINRSPAPTPRGERDPSLEPVVVASGSGYRGNAGTCPPLPRKRCNSAGNLRE